MSSIPHALPVPSAPLRILLIHMEATDGDPDTSRSRTSRRISGGPEADLMAVGPNGDVLGQLGYEPGKLAAELTPLILEAARSTDTLRLRHSQVDIRHQPGARAAPFEAT